MKLNYIVIPLVVVLVSLVGGWLTSGGIDSGWYDLLVKPDWTPSGGVIGTAWTIIFILTAASALVFYNRAARGARFCWTIAVFVLNALLNVFWSFLFFNQHLIGLAVFEAALLVLTVIALIVLIRPFSRLASILLLPYAGWVFFATYLTYVIQSLN